MRLTNDERIAALERENVVLHDTLKMLHRMLKEQRELTKSYAERMMAVSDDKAEVQHPEDVRYTYCCRPRFEKLEKQMEQMQKLVGARRQKQVQSMHRELFQ
jgi:hypothetical protein